MCLLLHLFIEGNTFIDNRQKFMIMCVARGLKVALRNPKQVTNGINYIDRVKNMSMKQTYVRLRQNWQDNQFNS